MRHTLILLSLLFALLTNTAYCAFCPSCGNNLLNNGDANYCPKCGKELKPKELGLSSADLLSEFESLCNDFEVYLTSTNYLTAIEKQPEFVIKIDKCIGSLSSVDINNADKSRLELLKAKYEIVKVLVALWSKRVSGENKLESEWKEFLLRKNLSAINETCKIYKTSKDSSVIDECIKTISTQPAEYKVTSKYLDLYTNTNGSYRKVVSIKKGSRFLVLEKQQDYVLLVDLDKDGLWAWPSMLFYGKIQDLIKNTNYRN